MDLYQVGGFSAALSQEIEQRDGHNRSAGLRARIFGAETGVSREVFRRYVEQAAPITVMDALERADVIVYADLRTRRVTDNPALRNRLAAVPGRDALERTAVRLRDIGDYVSISGRFRKAGATDSRTVFLAPYGDPDDPDGEPDGEAHVKVVCATGGLRADVIPDGSFQARCLGKVIDWEPAGRELAVDPIAIFR